MFRRGYFICHWKIYNFLLRRQDSGLLLLKSPIFEASHTNSEWSLELREDVPGFVSLYLIKESNPIAFRVYYDFLIWPNEIEPNDTYYSEKLDIGEESKERARLISWDSLIRGEQRYLRDGTLIVTVVILTRNTIMHDASCIVIESGSEIECTPEKIFNEGLEHNSSRFYSEDTIEIKKEFKTVSTQTVGNMKTESTQIEEICPAKDRKDLLRFFKEKDFDFVTLRTINKDITVHKAVLCAKSPVFNAMVERLMLENESSLVDIKDINGETLATFVRYLHFETLGYLHFTDIVKLFNAAKKYQVKQLEERCLDFVMEEFSVETVCDAFVMADLHQCESIMKRAFQFFCENSKLVRKSDKWKNLKLKYPELVNEILEKLADTM